MLCSVCLYNNLIFVADVDGNLFAYEYLKFKTKDEKKSFREKFRLKIPLQNPFHVKNIFLDVVDNFSTNLKCLMIVAVNLYYDISIHLFCSNVKRTFININTIDWLPLPNIEPGINFFITHGPSLLFSSPHEHLLCILPHNLPSRFNTSFADQSILNKIIQFESLRVLNIKEPTYVFILIESYETSEGLKKIQVCSLGKNKQSNSPVIYHQIPLQCFFPTHFQNSTEMVYTLNISVDESQINNLEDIDWKSNHCFLGTKTDSLLFCNGVLKYVFEKPGMNLSYIMTEFYEMPLSSVKFVIASKSKDIYYVTSIDSSSSLQILKTWENIEVVLTGDILMNGSRHLLLLSNTEFENWQDDCILSDISDLIPVEYVTQSLETEYSLNKAVPGIQAKILAGRSAIANTISKIENKMDATLDSLLRLNVFTPVNPQINHHASSFRESLVDIILSKDEVNKSEKNYENRIQLNVVKHWKQLCQSHWILSWSFSNNANRTIYNPVLNMWISDNEMQCFQRVIVHKSQTFSFEDEFRKQINPEENFTIVVSFEIPEFSCEILAVHGVLSWYIGTSTEFENELYLPLKEKVLNQQQMCLQTSISSDEIFSSELKDISTYEDLICVKIFQQRIVFTVLSLVSNLCNLEDLIMSSDTANNLLLLSSVTNILVFNKANRPLYGVHLTIKAINQTTVEVELYTRNEKETALVEKYLYQRLPSDILILANGVSASESIQLKQQAVCCMKEELDLLLSMLNIHNVQESIEKFDLQPGTVVISKENFLRIRKALLKKECRTDNIMQTLSKINFFKK